MFNLTFFVVLSDKICKPSPYILCWSREVRGGLGRNKHFSVLFLQISPSQGSRHHRSEAFSSPRDSSQLPWGQTDCERGQTAQTEIWSDRLVYRQTDRQTDRETERASSAGSPGWTGDLESKHCASSELCPSCVVPGRRSCRVTQCEVK